MQTKIARSSPTRRQMIGAVLEKTAKHTTGIAASNASVEDDNPYSRNSGNIGGRAVMAGRNANASDPMAIANKERSRFVDFLSMRPALRVQLNCSDLKFTAPHLSAIMRAWLRCVGEL
jgi:hypothetical protein